MTTSEVGIAFIKSNEGFAAHVYNDNGKQAIGYGHDLLPGEDFSAGITMAQGDSLLRNDLSTRFEPAVSALIPSDATQSQFDALIDFAYNLGIESLKTMLGHGWDQVPTQIQRWCYSGGAVSPGLESRRAKELALFQS